MLAALCLSPALANDVLISESEQQPVTQIPFLEGEVTIEMQFMADVHLPCEGIVRTCRHHLRNSHRRRPHHGMMASLRRGRRAGIEWWPP